MSIPFTVFDVETTGLDATEHEIIEFGFVSFQDGEGAHMHGALCNPYPGRDDLIDNVDGVIWEITGIDKEQLKKSASFEHHISTVQAFAAAPLLVAYNAPFDCRFMVAALCKAGREDLAKSFDVTRVIDPLVWIRNVDRFVKGAKRHTLAVTCERWGIPFEGAHRAASDAEATGRLLVKMSRRGVFPSGGIEKILKRQGDLRAWQDADYQKYAARMAAEKGVAGESSAKGNHE